MNAATEFDVGPLTWVKSEIDLALERALQAIDLYESGASSGAVDATQIKFCRTHLHQVLGALTIVGLDGVTQLVESLEGLLDSIEAKAQSGDTARIALVRKALSAIGQYLAGLVNGQINQPLRLFPLYQELQTARGAPPAGRAGTFGIKYDTDSGGCRGSRNFSGGRCIAYVIFKTAVLYAVDLLSGGVHPDFFCIEGFSGDCI